MLEAASFKPMEPLACLPANWHLQERRNRPLQHALQDRGLCWSLYCLLVRTESCAVHLLENLHHRACVLLHLTRLLMLLQGPDSFHHHIDFNTRECQVHNCLQRGRVFKTAVAVAQGGKRPAAPCTCPTPKHPGNSCCCSHLSVQSLMPGPLKGISPPAAQLRSHCRRRRCCCCARELCSPPWLLLEHACCDHPAPSHPKVFIQCN